MHTPDITMPTPDTLLTLALDGNDTDCIEQLGEPRHLVIQSALRLARDPEVAETHPGLTGRVLGRVERQRAARRWRR